ncbi:MAG: hypothetical protein ABJI69_00150 [Balneola sp.]
MIHQTKALPILNFPHPAWVIVINTESSSGYTIQTTQIIHFN